eukprot:CAMPEP_0119299910 /NCGR_PEP_ID=MMETSP1333-20130426/1932_1 /TAXON_ID=418940 /ORGANISM="Scyphosphaera apsteinii, Strain RCC1455" /LENGTH=157 /DNA_ID=CAMNT_0007301507 /DNA_START=42 /DNA_END=516 /DNA_ORIENTATION=+
MNSMRGQLPLASICSDTKHAEPSRFIESPTCILDAIDEAECLLRQQQVRDMHDSGSSIASLASSSDDMVTVIMEENSCEASTPPLAVSPLVAPVVQSMNLGHFDENAKRDHLNAGAVGPAIDGSSVLTSADARAHQSSRRGLRAMQLTSMDNMKDNF